MDGSSTSNGLGGRRGKGSMIVGWSFERFRVLKHVVKLRPSFTNSHFIPQQRSVLVPNDVLAPRFSSFQSHPTLTVLVESPLVAIR